tara:strand:+ start:1327 stop:2850 length:1524 start_codon:yes stop_codon:yes gene_type:complete
MNNTFFCDELSNDEILLRLFEIENGRVGFYSVGLYPASLAYNCAMQTNGDRLLLATREGRELLGSFPKSVVDGMDDTHIKTMTKMGMHKEFGKDVKNTLSDLILRCELVILSANSNYVEDDLKIACNLRNKLNRNNVVLACLAGSFSHDSQSNKSYVLCEKEQNLGFFTGFHRHGALRNPLDSFTANFCHPNSLTAILAARMLDKLSPNIQVSSGVHNLEGQYIKAAKNMSSIFAGFGHEYHKENTGLLPTLLTLLHDQSLDQAASVSMIRENRKELYGSQSIPLTELGYGVQKIEAALLKEGELEKVRDHTFSQLTAMVADVHGSMMQPVTGLPTRNFQAGQVLARSMRLRKRCPKSSEELIDWCETDGLNSGGLEGLKALKYWPQIIQNYSIPLNDSSMINLLFMCINGPNSIKGIVFEVMTQSRELTNYCQESVRPFQSRIYVDALNNIDSDYNRDLILNAVKGIDSSLARNSSERPTSYKKCFPSPYYLRLMYAIEAFFNNKN